MQLEFVRRPFVSRLATCFGSILMHYKVITGREYNIPFYLANNYFYIASELLTTFHVHQFLLVRFPLEHAFRQKMIKSRTNFARK